MLKSAWRLVFPVLVLCWIVAGVRFIADAALKPAIMHPVSLISVYFAVALALLIIAVRKTWAEVPARKFYLGALIIGVCAFGVPNAISYTTGQFQGWTHGRFRPPAEGKEGFGEDPDARAAPIRKTSAAKVGTGCMIGGLTIIAGFLWTSAIGTLVILLPAWLRRRRAFQV